MDGGSRSGSKPSPALTAAAENRPADVAMPMP
jgi:hypothetical protein